MLILSYQYKDIQSAGKMYVYRILELYVNSE